MGLFWKILLFPLLFLLGLIALGGMAVRRQLLFPFSDN